MTITKKSRLWSLWSLSRPYMSMEGMFKCSNSMELKPSDFIHNITVAEHFKLVLRSTDCFLK